MNPILIAAIVFSVLYFLLIGYFLVGWLRLKSAKDDAQMPDESLPFVSIVLPVRNESEYIAESIQSILNQNYPQNLFEIIVVDDYSTDPTLRLAREFEKPNVLIFDLQQYLGNPGEYTANKKKAISLGIKNAKGEVIITTDGDCMRGENWLCSMVGYYLAHSFKLVTGPVMVKPARTPFACFQQLDVITLLGITGGSIRNKAPLMCNGSNLLYAKQTFLDIEGFKGNNECRP
ncbi:MAG: glycosyltransferase [Bacteroidetes bacterium]|nr:glycosyltransferase [Bacteroidota bacterium]